MMFVEWLLVDLSCFVAYHLRISCCFRAVMFQSYACSCCIELVVRRQHPASFHLVDLICYGLLLHLRVGVISARLSLANGLDDPVTY